MNVRIAMSRVAGAAIDLSDQLAPVRQVYSRDRTDCRRAVWVDQSHAKKRAWVRRFVFEKVRRAPLVRRHKIQPAIAIDIRDRNSSGDQRFGQAELRRNVVVLSIRRANEEWIAIVAT